MQAPENVALAVAPGGCANDAEDELGDFSYIVSHDIATEFRHIALFSRMLLQDPQRQAPGAGRRHAEIIALAAERCQAMLDQVRAYSNVQRAQLVMRSGSGRRLVETALGQLAAKIRDTRAVIAVDVTGEMWVDDEMIVRAIRHVLDNALKFSRPDTPPRLGIMGRAGAGGVFTLRVIDDGLGLERAHWDKAFRMFWRLDPDRPASGGAGAGLAICRRILRRHGGDARFVGGEGGGACVEIVIPVPDATRTIEGRAGQ